MTNKSDTNEENSSSDKLSLPPEIEKRLDKLEAHLALLAEPIATRKSPDRSKWSKLADALETSVPSRIIVGLGALLTFFSLAGILATAWGVRLQYLSMEEERVARAWQALATNGLGNGGKLKAIELIHSKGEDLSGINIGGTSRSTSSILDTLTLKNASIWDGNWNYTSMANSTMEGGQFGRMQLKYADISGRWETQIVWSDLSNASFLLERGSQLSLDTVIADYATFYFTALPEAKNGVTVFKNEENNSFNVTEHGTVLLGDEAAEHKARLEAGVMVSFDNVSLRCALMPSEHAINASFSEANLSGAYLGVPNGVYEDDKKDLIGNISEREWAKFSGAWHFSDNPPVGVPDTFLEKYFTAVDRDTLIKQCEAFEPRARADNPFAFLDAVDGIESACVSLARISKRCDTQYPAGIIFGVGGSHDDLFRLKD